MPQAHPSPKRHSSSRNYSQRQPSRWWVYSRRLLSILLLLCLLALALIITLRWLPPPTSSFMLQAEAASVDYRWIDWSAIPDDAKLAAIAAEDQKFPSHHGFDIESINSAIDEYRDGKRLRGASTISQQVCKNLFLWSGGGLFRKGLEAVCTGVIETLWPKRRILEIYLNIAEFGPGIYGIEAAAQRLMTKPAASLSRREYALLMAVLPSPRRYSATDPSDYVQQRAAWIERQMRQLGVGYLDSL
ncbi:MAG: monofunctional biosynthetic peptidoglycan transglycosylase [Wenzhouxiangellaceae bacterium]